MEALADSLPHLSVGALQWIIGGGLTLGFALGAGTLIVLIARRKRPYNRIDW